MGYTVRELALMRIEEVEREIEIWRDRIDEGVHVEEAKRKISKYEKELEKLHQMV